MHESKWIIMLLKISIGSFMLFLDFKLDELDVYMVNFNRNFLGKLNLILLTLVRLFSLTFAYNQIIYDMCYIIMYIISIKYDEYIVP